MFMKLDENNKPTDWSKEPKEGFIEVPDIMKNIHTAFPRYVWDGENLVKPSSIPLPPPTDEEIIAGLQSAVQEHLDVVARRNYYDDIKSAALRAAYPGSWQEEGIAYATWMDRCWSKCYEVMAEVKGGIKPIPTNEELIAALPLLERT